MNVHVRCFVFHLSSPSVIMTERMEESFSLDEFETTVVEMLPHYQTLIDNVGNRGTDNRGPENLPLRHF